MRLIGHRGCPAYAPENTIEAVELAVPHVDAVEVDVQRCGTGELVVFHDTTLDRLTAASGPVAATDFDTLSSLSIGESDSTIPTLAELLSSVPPSVGVNVELKHAGMATDLQAILADVENEILVSSFVPRALAELADGYTRGFLFDESFEEALDVAEALGCEAIHPEYKLVTPARVDAAHARGFEVNAWTPQTAAAVGALRSAGVDGVIVDDWALLE